MSVSVMIPTRDRCADLRSTLRELKRLVPSPDEVLIFADGCADGTRAMVSCEFPGFRLMETRRPMGSVYCRDRMLRMAVGDIVLSLDDDSYPLQPDFIEQLQRVFAQHPEAAVIVFPELRAGNCYAGLNKTPTSPGRYVAGYANCAAAMRRSDYLGNSGFLGFFGHMYEEPDYALQCYAAGKSVWFESSLSIRHRQSEIQRFPRRRHHLNARNELWSVWVRCPWPWLPLISLYRLLRQFRYACSEGLDWAFCEPQWWLAAAHGIKSCSRHRQAVPWKIYRQWLTIERRPILSIDTLRTLFPVPGARVSWRETQA